MSDESPVFVVSGSAIHGFGAFARREIFSGEKIVEYIGEKISKIEANDRCIQGNPYIFCLDDDTDIDGSVEWNPARFINHHCNPNCYVERDEGHLWVIAQRNIASGEELTYDYGYDLSEYREHSCRCGAAECVGFIVAEEFRDHVRGATALRNSC